MKIGLLHTAAAHVPVFDRLLADLGPHISVCHEVQGNLLDEAIKSGLNTSVRQGVQQALHKLVAEDCRAVACTCSTLGQLAEGVEIEGIVVQRIDRAAADLLVQFDRVLVLAAIESAAQAADQLLEGSLTQRGGQTSWLVVLVPGAWQFFIDGDTEAYWAAIADFANDFGDEFDAVYLSQASMLGAERRCHHNRVITTPVEGVRRLVESLET